MVVACCAPMWPSHPSGRKLPPALGDQQLLTPSSLPPQYASLPDAFERSTHASSLTGSRLGCVHKFRLRGASLRVKRLPRYGVTRGLSVANLQRRQRLSLTHPVKQARRLRTRPSYNASVLSWASPHVGTIGGHRQLTRNVDAGKTKGPAISRQALEGVGRPCRDRTYDQRIKSPRYRSFLACIGPPFPVDAR